MKKGDPKNLAASVRQRLLVHSRKTHEDFQLVLTRYAIERLLFRLSQSKYRDQFILKGAMLFQLWGGGVHRATRDLDLLGQGLNTVPRLEGIFRDVCNVQVPEDGLHIDAKTVRAEEIKPDDEYQGIRVSVECGLENAQIHLQIDIGFGDIVTPAPTEVSFPTVLSFPAPVLKAYPKESVIAEKLQAMVALGIANSRMKDFYDLYYLANNFDFDGALLAEAVSKTFKRRQTMIPQDLPLALSDEFAEDPTKQSQWNGFVRKGRVASSDITLGGVVVRLREFFSPLMAALASDIGFRQIWTPNDGWH